MIMSNSVSLTTQDIPNAGSRTIATLLSDNAHWALRIALISVFVYHGVGKFADLGAFAAMMNLPFAIALLVAVVELGGGVLLLAGGFTQDWVTRIGAAMFVPVMLGAIAMVHWPQWSFVPSSTHPMGGMEFQAVLLLVSLYFVMRGNNA
jgi:putative oxidoreductase